MIFNGIRYIEYSIIYVDLVGRKSNELYNEKFCDLLIDELSK